MKFHLPTKISFAILALIILALAIFVAINYNNVVKQPSSLNVKPTGVCEPGSGVCELNATGSRICLENNKQVSC